MFKVNRVWLLALLTMIVFAAMPAFAAGGAGLPGYKLQVWQAIPFAGILLSIAIFPLVAPHFWHHHFGKIAAVWGVLGVAVLFLGPEGKFEPVLYEVLHIILLDYVPFIILLLALFTIAGGIRVKGRLRGSPMVNTGILLIGTILASWMGTTGAAMLLIRPMIKANAWRKRKVHLVVFFIFLVCNVGGSLTPLGDPPLFLGFLRGVDFFWTMNMLPSMTIVSILLLAVFFVFDKIMLAKEELNEAPAEEGEEQEKFGLEGSFNFLLLAALIVTILVTSDMVTKDGGMTGGPFYDNELASHYDEALTASTAMTMSLKDAAKQFADEKYDDAYASYSAAIKEQNVAYTEVHHGEDHEHGEKDETAHAGGEKHHGVEIGEKLVKKKELKAEWAGKLENRQAAIKAAQTSAPSDEDKAMLQSMIVLDYQLAGMHTNGVRAAQSHDAVGGVYVPGVNHLKMPMNNVIRDLVLLLLAVISWVVTSKESRKKNGFTWFPIVEVAKLFAGIFVCIIPALKILQAGVEGQLSPVVDMVTGPDGMPLNEMYFWLTGGLSSFLDNAPTYLVFFNTAGGDASTLMNDGFPTLLAISMGAVFMGANTYIGNAPNFMVRSIAEENDIPMPSFFGYMFWSVIFLVPIFIIITLIFGMLADIRLV